MPTRTHGGAINGAIKDLYATVANRCRIERSRLYGQYTNDEQLDLNSVSFTLTWAAIDALLLAATADVVLSADALPRWLLVGACGDEHRLDRPCRRTSLGRKRHTAGGNRVGALIALIRVV